MAARTLTVAAKHTWLACALFSQNSTTRIYKIKQALESRNQVIQERRMLTVVVCRHAIPFVCTREEIIKKTTRDDNLIP